MDQVKILIVEDERIVALDIKYKLQQLGYTVLGIFASGEEALKFLNKNSPDILIMDIMIQGEIDGIELAEIIKEKYHLPYIFLSAFSDEKTIQRVKLTEPHGYIVKPFNSSDLKTTVELAIHKAKIEKKLFESELKYRTLFETANDAVFTIDKKGNIASANKRANNLFGFIDNNYDETNISQILFNENCKDFFDFSRGEFFQNESILKTTIEVTGKNNSGSNFPVELSASKWIKGEEPFFTLILRDISLRKKYEKELKDARDNLKEKVRDRTKEINALIEQSIFPICTYNSDGSISDMNLKYRELWEKLYENEDPETFNINNDPILKHYGYLKDVQNLFQVGGKKVTKSIFFDSDDVESNEFIYKFNYYSVKNDRDEVYKVVNILEDVTTAAREEDTRQKLIWQRKYSELLLEKLEEEKTRISRELHDEIGPILYTAKFNLEAYVKKNNIQNENLEQTKNLVTKAGIELKDIIYELQPLVLERYGLFEALKILCEDVRKQNIVVISKIPDLKTGLSKKIEFNIYRVVQEIFNNSLRHSKTTEMRLDLSISDEFILIICQDNGIGFNYELAYEQMKSFGLKNIEDRIGILKGSLSVESEKDKGTKIQIEIPRK